MKNHFFFPYTGNKRTEVEKIYDSIKDKMENIKCIIEPFCGSSALSYYIWLNNKEKNYKYILNDNNEKLIELYKIVKDEKKFNELFDKLNKIVDKIFSYEEFEKRKEEYKKNVNKEDLLGYCLKNRVFQRVPGLFPSINENFRKRTHLFINAPVIDFLRNANIEFYNKSGLDIYKEYCNKPENLIFLDPPYLLTCNSLYENPIMDIYEYLVDNDIENNKALIVLCLENNFIIKLLFKKYNSLTYQKRYENNHKKTEHVIILNKK